MKCEFYIEYSYNNRDYGTLFVNEENINLSIIKQGLAKVVEKRGTQPASKYYEELIAAQQDNRSKKQGVWTGDEKVLLKHTRQALYYQQEGFNAAKIFTEAQEIDKPLQAIIEYVFSASFLSVYVVKFEAVVRVSMVHLFTPNTDKQFVADGKAFTEKFLLHRTVGIKFDRVEEGGNFVARIFHPAGDIASEILKAGYSKLNTPKTQDFDADYFRSLKEAQFIAQSKQLRLWKDFKAEEKKQKQLASTTNFVGQVCEIHSGDSLTIERESDLLPIRVYLSSVKAPIYNKARGEDPDPYAWESKEALRKATIGKKVKVIMEFSKTVQIKTSGEDRNMDFASVFLEKNDKNVSVLLLEKGLLKTSLNKSMDNASKYLEDLLAAEKKAADSKQGVYSLHPAPIKVFSDIVQDPRKAKQFEAMLMKRPSKKMTGVVEYCFSGMRFKVRLDGESTSIGLNILGVKTMPNDKNQPQFLKFSNEALQLAKDTLFQRDVIVEPEFVDKRGSFFGSLCLANTKKDFALMLVEEGLGEVNIVGGKAPINIDQIEDAQYKA